MLSAVPRGRDAELTLEGPIERRLGSVADVDRNLQYGLGGGLEEARGELQSPAREICQRRLAEQLHEALTDNRPRCTRLPCQFRERPAARGIPVQQRERGADQRIPRA